MTLREVAERVGGRFNPGDGEVAILGVGSLTEAEAGDLSFYGNPKYFRDLCKSRAAAVLVPRNFSDNVPPACVWVDDPVAAFALVLKDFAPRPVTFAAGVHPTAVVAQGVVLGEGVSIQPHVVVEPGARIAAGTWVGAQAYIGHDVEIGADCRIFPGVIIGERCRLGDRVVLHPGVVIGSEGFGYEKRGDRQVKVPQTGTVQIDDDVEIGANTTVDRARFGRTWIQEGTKVDNLVQIAHNVRIGKHCVICAQVGISGSVRVGDGVTLAGKVGVNGHIEIGDGAVAGAMAGITKNVPPKEVLLGVPARPMREFKETFALVHNIRKLYDRVKVLEKRGASRVE